MPPERTPPQPQAPAPRGWSPAALNDHPEIANKLVLVVEGKDDKLFIEALLRLELPDWEAQLAVIVANSRNRALKLTAVDAELDFAGAFCFVDRDVWTDMEVERRRHANPRLFVSQGWCIENLFVAAAAAGAFGGETTTRMQVDLHRWLCAGAFWRCLQRVQDDLTKLHGGGVYGEPLAAQFEDEAGLRALLAQSIPDGLAPLADELAARWRARLGELGTMPQVEQWRVGVHGKRYWRDKD